MCKGQRLSGPQARKRVLAIIGWLHEQAVLGRLSEADQLLAAAGMAGLREDEFPERALLQRLALQPLPAATPVIATARLTNLPAPLNSFVGRMSEVGEVAQLVTTKRLVTLTGAGGVGKTRLALEVAKQFLASPVLLNVEFSDGIWFVELAALIGEDLGVALVAQAIAQLFKQPEQAGHTTLHGLQQYLADKHLLLVLDNCEHLVDACAEISERLLHHCWQLHILATSREEMRIPGEVVYSVLPLALPAATEKTLDGVLACAAAQLFVERMSATLPMLKIQEAEMATLAHICRQLDGIPLALELAAPLTRSLSLTELATQLDNQMALLTNGYRTAIPRHQTMHSALIWSYRLLSPDEQQLLTRISVFVGGWTLAAAKLVCADEVSSHAAAANILALLDQLHAKSLVLVEAENSERRYRLLEPVRQFAHAQLVASGEQEVIGRRHAYYFLSLAEQMDQARDTLQEREWLQTLAPERNNLRAVNQWAFEHNEAEFAQRFNGFLCAFWIYSSSIAEASHWLEGALALNGTESEAGPTPLALMAQASALNTAGHAAALSYNFTRAQILFERELRLRTALDDHRGIANALRGISFALMLSNNNLSEAQRYSDQALAIDRAAQDSWGIAWSLFDLGYLALVRGNLPAAQALLTEALPLLQAQGINFGLFRGLLALGHVMRAVGNNDHARHFYRNALHLQQQMHYVQHIADGLEGLAAIAAAAQNALRAVQLWGAAHAHRQSIAMTRPYHQEAGYERAITLTHRQLSTEAWNAAWAAGCAMTLEQAVEYALTA